jgi:hypothetical protein
VDLVARGDAQAGERCDTRSRDGILRLEVASELGAEDQAETRYVQSQEHGRDSCLFADAAKRRERLVLELLGPRQSQLGHHQLEPAQSVFGVEVVGLLVGLGVRIARIWLHPTHPGGLGIRATTRHCCESSNRRARREAH